MKHLSVMVSVNVDITFHQRCASSKCYVSLGLLVFLLHKPTLNVTCFFP